ncbi:DUF2490 domain-containing protein [Rudanella lutea]|uniref:DUF2490 domain-containing protein n=1 Tax=Rudanella lutea TaxID=451374 RepID=UPI0003A90EA4|nr:DUF2490 domain-containing protein [Rudanella lutea]
MLHKRLVGQLACLLFSFGWVGGALAQTTVPAPEPLGSWVITTLQLPSGPKHWGGFFEIQGRSYRPFQQFFYNELKGGVSYDLDRNFTFTLAGGRYATYDYNDLSAGPLNTEKRLWEQLVINQYLDRLRFEHRYRIEQRWFQFRDGSDSFRSRIRYRLNVFLPLNNRKLTSKTFFLSSYDEIFLNPKGPAFERNRLYAGLGYQFDRNFTMQVGWVNQVNYTPARFEQGVFTPKLAASKHNVVLTLTYRLNRRNNKTPSETLPSQSD